MKKLWIIAVIFIFAACGSDGDINFASSPAAAPVPPTQPMPATEGGRVEMAFDGFADAVAGDVQRWHSEGRDGLLDSGLSTLYGMPTEAPQMVETTEQRQSITQTRRIIREAHVDMETYDFDDAMNALRDVPTLFGGYIERSSLDTLMRTARHRETTRRFRITLRVPVEKFDTALSYVEGLATVEISRQSAQDVTDQFYDMETRLETRLIEEDRILALIEEADTLREILDLEQRLSAVRLQIGRYQSSLNELTQQTTYSTINVTLWELQEDEEEILIAPLTFTQQLGEAFSTSLSGTGRALQEFAVFLAGAFVPLIILGALGYIIFKIFMRYRAA